MSAVLQETAIRAGPLACIGRQQTALRIGPAVHPVHLGRHERTGTRAGDLVFATCRQGKRT